MKTIWLFSIVLSLLNSLQAQVYISPQVISTAGNSVSVGNLDVSWTLGETLITNLKNEDIILSQGFQQNIPICIKEVDYLFVKAGNPYKTLFQLNNEMIISQIPELVSILVTNVCSKVKIESFEMNLQGPEFNWNIVQNIFPNALFDNSGNNVYGRNFTSGNYTLTVTGYSQDNKQGSITYGPIKTNFKITGNNVTIAMPTITKYNLCAGEKVDVTFSSNGSFSTTNQFQIQLSTPNGSFESPTTIGYALTEGIVSCTIPLNTQQGDGYLIRVISTNPINVSNPAISRLSINPLNYLLTYPNDNESNGTSVKKAVSTIIANNSISSPAKTTFQAGGAINLMAGFEVSTGAIFKAEIKGCNN